MPRTVSMWVTREVTDFREVPGLERVRKPLRGDLGQEPDVALGLLLGIVVCDCRLKSYGSGLMKS